MLKTMCAACVLMLCMVLTALLVGEPRPGPGDATPLLVIGIPRLSWDRVVDGLASGDMPWMAKTTSGACAWGDLIGRQDASEEEILAEVMTGQFRDWGESAERTGVPIWARMASVGIDVKSIGFAVNERGAVAEVAAAEPVFARLVDGFALPERVLTALRVSASSDLAAVRSAEQAAGGLSGPVFVYLAGLRGLEEAVEGLEQEDVAGEWRGELMCRYYAFLDKLLEKTAEPLLPDCMVVLFSEAGNHGGPVRCRTRAPVQEEWPPMGFFLATGGPVRRTPLPQMAAPADIAATLLYVSGCPIPRSMDGRIQFGIFREEMLFTRTIRVCP